MTCEYLNCNYKAKWHVVNGWGLDKNICTVHKNKMDKRDSWSFCEPIIKTKNEKYSN